MSSPPAVPEVRGMDAAEDPAAAGSMTGAPMEAPVAKAAGPAGPPVPVMIPDEPNISGSTVHGVLLEGKDLLEIPIEEIFALSLSSIEPADSLINDVCYEVSKTEAERWHRSADLAQDHVYPLKAQMDQLARQHASDPSQPLEEIRVPTDRKTMVACPMPIWRASTRGWWFGSSNSDVVPRFGAMCIFNL